MLAAMHGTTPQPDRRPLQLHEAAYSVIARALGIEIRPRRETLRCFNGDLRWPYGADDIEAMATIALSGRAALAREGLDGDRDQLLASDLIFEELIARFGSAAGKATVRQYVTTRLAELTDRAAQLIDEHWPAIEAAAARLRAAIVTEQKHGG